MKPPLEKSLSYKVKSDKTPGPAHYDPNFDFLLQKGTQKGVSFSKFERLSNQRKSLMNEKSDSNTTGSFYNIDEKKSGPFYRFPFFFLTNRKQFFLVFRRRTRKIKLLH